MNADVEKAVGELRAACGDGSFAMSAVSTANVLTALKALRDQEAEIARLREVAALMPTSWLDPLLTGSRAALGDPPYKNADIERLLKALHDRITAHLGSTHE